jgi:NitT/TauT family transport system permease protein
MMDDNVNRLPQGEPSPGRNPTETERRREVVAGQRGEDERGTASWRRRIPASFFSLLLGMVIWELTGRWAGLRFLPPFSQVLLAGADLIVSGQIISHLAASLLSLLAGYSMAVALGLTLGGLMGRYRTVEYVLDPYLNAFLATPKIVLLPVMYTFFGLSRLVQVAVIFLSAFFVIVLNTMRGIQTVDPSYVEMARAFGAGGHQLFRKVLLPGALPLTMAGLRLAMGHAVKGMVTGEMFITVFGLGALLRIYGGRFDAERVFAILLLVIGVGVACSYVIAAVERRLTHWMSPKI